MTDEPEQNIFILERPMYRVVVIVDGHDVDIQIQLTAKGKRYAAGRARGYHHFMRDDEDALTEIIHARDTYYPTAQRPDRMLEAKF